MIPTADRTPIKKSAKSMAAPGPAPLRFAIKFEKVKGELIEVKNLKTG